jgi:hypothetical protein
MTAHVPIAAGRDDWAQLRARAAAADNRRWHGLVSGHHDAERLRRSRTAIRMVAALPPPPLPNAAEARRRSDAALALLIADFIAR